MVSLAQPKRRLDRRATFAVAAGAAAALAVAWWSLADDAPGSVATAPRDRPSPSVEDAETARGPLRLRDGSELSALVAEGTERVARLEDGSSIRVQPGGRLAPVANDADELSLVLEAGRATFEVRPGGQRRWRIGLGQVDVEVVGTQFTLTRSEARISVEVTRGAVRVSGPAVGRARLLHGGDAAVFTLAPARVAAEPPVHRRAPPSPPEADWRRQVEAGAPAEAFAMLQEIGYERAVREAEDARTLFQLADAARLSGHPREAVSPLSRIVDEFPQTRLAAVAAFTLGRIQIESLAQPERAARSFERALELDLPPSLRESASSRRLAAYRRAGRTAELARAACDHLRAFPDGQGAAAARAACPTAAGDLDAPQP